jgi:hypothetical protein
MIKALVSAFYCSQSLYENVDRCDLNMKEALNWVEIIPVCLCTEYLEKGRELWQEIWLRFTPKVIRNLKLTA